MLRLLFASIAASIVCSACATADILPDDPFNGVGPALTIIPINHTDRYIPDLYVDQYWGANVYPHNGGGSGVCCYPGLKNWGKPVRVIWRWGMIVDPKTKVVIRDGEDRLAVVHFPEGGPKRSGNTSEDEAYLCVIFRDSDKVELAFATKGSACAGK